MKGSLVLTILIAFCAIHGNGALDATSSLSTPAPSATSNPSTPAPDTTSSPPTLAPDATSSPSTPALDTTSSPSTPAPSATGSRSTPAPDTTSSSPTLAPDATGSPSTPKLDTTSSPSTPEPSTTGSPSTPAPVITSSPPTPAPSATGSTSTPALDATSSPPTPAPSVTGSPSKPAPDATSSPPTPAPSATGSPSKPAPDTTSSPPTPAPSATGSPSKPAPSATSSPSKPAPDTTGSPPTPAPSATSSPPTTAPDATSLSTPAPNVTELPSTTQGALPCTIQPCKYGATCINLWQEYVCQCPYGFFYGLSGCQPGKIFPGQLRLTMPFDKEMQTINSSAYQKLYKNVTQFFSVTFETYTDYKQTILVSVEQSPSTSTRLRMAGTEPVVKIINIFNESTDLTENNVTDIIEKSPAASAYSFTSVEQCAVYGCDVDTTYCVNPKDAQQFPTCDCKSDLAKKNPEDKACLLCDEQCTSKNYKQCFHREKGVPYCTCQADYELKEGKCEPCSFGFSGKNCRNNFLAILVGVAVACGVVIIILTGALIYKSLRAHKESSSETRSLLNSDFSNMGRAPENNYATNVATREKIFPRVQTRNPAVVNQTVMDSQGGEARNTQETGVSNEAYIPERDYGDEDNTWLEMSTRGKL